MDKDENNFFYINLDMKEPDLEIVRKEQKIAISQAEPKTLKLYHRTRRNEFYHNLEEYEKGNEKHVPEFISDYFSWLEDYIEKLENKVEDLEKNVKVEKKVMYRVEVIYEHDLDTEHRQVYFGPDVKQARKEFMNYFNFFDTTGDELYYFPIEEVIGSREEQRKYTGLELQQKFLDMFNQHIRENKSIDFSCNCDNFATEYGQDVGDGLVGCKVDILEV